MPLKDRKLQKEFSMLLNNLNVDYSNFVEEIRSLTAGPSDDALIDSKKNEIFEILDDLSKGTHDFKNFLSANM